MVPRSIIINISLALHSFLMVSHRNSSYHQSIHILILARVHLPHSLHHPLRPVCLLQIARTRRKREYQSLKINGDEILPLLVSPRLHVSHEYYALRDYKARFRIKKKQRTLNLDRSVSDLTGRAEELEREATELRRENGWLKEIVMLRGRSLTGSTRAAGGSEGQREGGDSSEDESEESDNEDSGVNAAKKGTNVKDKGKGKAK
jgi:hypothetical protein